MADKKVIKKTVDLTGKKTKKASLVLKAAKSAAKIDARKHNEAVAAKMKKAAEEAKAVKAVKPEAGGKKELKKEEKFEEKKYELKVTLQQMLAAGCHLGHKAAKTHPRSRDNIYGIKDGIQVFDLIKSRQYLEAACNYIYNAVRRGKKIVLVGTKRQAKEPVKRVAEEAGAAYVTNRWLGGTISNWEQVSKNIKKLKNLKEGVEKGEFAEATKKELSVIRKEIIRLERIIGGIAQLDKLFDAVFVVDSGTEKTAVREARGRKIVSVALTDSDSDPTKVDYPIPVNDDNAKSISLIVEEIGRAIKAGGEK